MLKPDNRVVMITGASRGMGRAAADRLKASGFRISGGMRTPVGTRDPEREIACHYEAEDEATAKAWVEETVRHFGQIDAVVNAAGINPKVRVFGDGEEDLERMWRVNVMGPLRLVRAARPHLEKCGHGRVINIGSLSSKRVASNVGYAMTKFAVAALTHGIRREGREAGIRATVICPGYVATDMTLGETEITRDEMTQPEDIAALIETALCLPNNAAVSELLVHCQYEPML